MALILGLNLRLQVCVVAAILIVKLYGHSWCCAGVWCMDACAEFECAKEGIDVSQGTPVSVRKCSIVCTPKQSHKCDSGLVSRKHRLE